MTKKQISHMVDRFLGYKLPQTFSPDAGIVFTPANGMTREEAYEKSGWWPVGTNLLTAMEAQEMIEYMLDGFPAEDEGEEEDIQSRAFLLTDCCMFEQNRKQGTFHPHAVEVVDIETGQVRYIQSGARIRFIDGIISAGRTQEDYNKIEHAN